MSLPSFKMERIWLSSGDGWIAGVDEVGRGPLAGPVAAAAVILNPSRLPRGVDDSKKLTPAAREDLFDRIMGGALAVGIGFGSVEEIERINIREASFLAMRRAIAALSLAPSHALIDGNAIPVGLPCAARAIIGGDALCLSIAAASIVAKVTRDRLMGRLHLLHPRYGFATNVGYGSKAHLAALLAHGATDCHRRGFAPVRDLLSSAR
jgi:ribonuclease HII